MGRNVTLCENVKNQLASFQKSKCAVPSAEGETYLKLQQHQEMQRPERRERTQGRELHRQIHGKHTQPTWIKAPNKRDAFGHFCRQERRSLRADGKDAEYSHVYELGWQQIHLGLQKYT